MIRRQWVLIALVTLALAIGWSVWAGEPVIVRHSGTVVAIDREGGTIFLSEVGPWHPSRGLSVVKFAVLITPETRFTLLERSAEAPVPGDFLERPGAFADLKLGDFVTVECLHEGKRLVALRIFLTKLEES